MRGYTHFCGFMRIRSGPVTRDGMVEAYGFLPIPDEPSRPEAGICFRLIPLNRGVGMILMSMAGSESLALVDGFPAGVDEASGYPIMVVAQIIRVGKATHTGGWDALVDRDS